MRYRVRAAWTATRLGDALKRRLIDYFVLGVPAYRLRFHALASAPTVERFYRLMRQVIAIEEESTAPFEGAIECDETMLGGYREGKRGWGAAGKVIILGILQRNGVVRVFPVRGVGAPNSNA